MKEEDKIINRFGKEAGWKVPEGYFDSLPERIAASMPEPAEQPEVRVSRWQRFKPYVYLAAMFAGIWLMMNVFHHVSGVGSLNLENPPENIAMLMEQPEISDYYCSDMVGEAEVLSEGEAEYFLSGEYSDIKEFERDFYKGL